MTTLYSSSFLSIILGFLIFMTQNGQPITRVENPKPPSFSNIKETEKNSPFNRVKIELFDNLTCNDCSDFVKNTLPKIRNLEQETETIDLRLYFIPDINDENYFMAALALKCAADQDAYWTMLDKIHDNKDDLNRKSFFQFAKELNLQAEALEECITEESHRASVEEDIKYASSSEITFLPALQINQYKLIGNQPFENIQQVINKAFAGLQSETPPQPEVQEEKLPVKDLTPGGVEEEGQDAPLSPELETDENGEASALPSVPEKDFNLNL